MKKFIFALSAASLALGGCATLDTVHYAWPGPGETEVITTDAKTRHLIMTKYDSGKIRACAEPAPDAFSAFSNSFSFKGIFGATSNDVSAANAFATTAATIERTQTINLLRESMYRTCERWLSGALEQDQFLTLAARDHRSMVAVLAIEQLTGVVKKPSTIISGPAISMISAQNEALVKLLIDYSSERKAAQKAYADARQATSSANKDVTVGGTMVKACSQTEKPTEPEAAAAFDQCQLKAASEAEAKKLYEDALARENAIIEQIGDLSSGLSTAIKKSDDQKGGLPEDSQQATALSSLADVVGKIALTSGVDEGLMFCLGYLARKTSIDPAIRDMCNNLVRTRQARDNEFVAKSIFGVDYTPEMDRENERQSRIYSDFEHSFLSHLASLTDEQYPSFRDDFAKNSGLLAFGEYCRTRRQCIDITIGGGFASMSDQFQKLSEALGKSKETK